VKLAVVGEGAEAQRCAAALSRRGYEIAIVPGVPRRALGNPVKAVDTASGERIRCDAVAIAIPPAPLHELASSVGAQAHFDGAGFPVETDADGRTSVPWLFAAGTVARKDAAKSQGTDRKSTRLNSRHRTISYAVVCVKKKSADRGVENLSEDRKQIPSAAYTSGRFRGAGSAVTARGARGLPGCCCSVAARSPLSGLQT